MMKTRKTQATIQEIANAVNSDPSQPAFTESEMKHYLEEMQQETKVLIEGGVVYLQ